MKLQQHDKFFDNEFSFGLIIRADINTIDEIKRYIAEHEIKIVFQKISTNKLWVKEDDG